MNAARRLVEAGDRGRALEEITAALALDPDFLAAQSLKERLLAEPDALACAPELKPPPASAAIAETASSPVVSTEGYAQFEARAKRRRVDRRVDAARSAIENRRLHQAAAALDDINELDPNLPELAELMGAFDELRRCTRRPRRGPSLAAAAVFVAGVLGASWLQDATTLQSHPTSVLATLVAPAAVFTLAPSAVHDEAPGSSETNRESDARLEPEAVPISGAKLPVPAPITPVAVRAQMDTQPEPTEAPDVATATVPSAPLVRPSALGPTPTVPAAPQARPATLLATAAPPRAPVVDEADLIRRALQRYRTAYGGLDARSAQAVWPAVNQAALARAFGGLQSQTLTFDTCDVQVHDDEDANATCLGFAQYTAKVGSREPRIEPRVWTFTLRKAGGDWQIESARAERRLSSQ